VAALGLGVRVAADSDMKGSSVELKVYGKMPEVNNVQAQKTPPKRGLNKLYS
jgi:hypothetical protein